MKGMFSNCTNLSSLNISNFDTSNVNNMQDMFANCINLTTLDLFNFNTSQVDNMNSIFANCINLASLNLFNFDLSNIKSIDNMFYGCYDLEYINLNISKINTRVTTKINTFSQTHQNLILCTENTENDNDIFINIFSEKKKFFFKDISQSEYIYICFMKNSSLYNHYICDICEKKLLMNNNTLNDNNSYNICLEYIDENFYINYTDINSQSFNISNINIESNKNDIDNFYEQIINYSLYELNITNNNYEIISNYINNTEDNSFNSDISQLIGDSDINEPITIIFFNNSQIEKINQTIENIINNLIYEFNTSELDNGIDKKITDKNKEIVLTTTNNQKKK